MQFNIQGQVAVVRVSSPIYMPMPNDRAGVRGELRYGCSISPGIRGLALEFMSLADLDEKLTQYPAGATFRWQSGGAGASHEAWHDSPPII